MTDFREQYLPPKETFWSNVRGVGMFLSFCVWVNLFCFLVFVAFDSSYADQLLLYLITSTVLLAVLLIVTVFASFMRLRRNRKLFSDWFKDQKPYPDQFIKDLLPEWGDYYIFKISGYACIALRDEEYSTTYYIRVSIRVQQTLLDHIEQGSWAKYRTFKSFMMMRLPDLLDGATGQEGR